MKPSDDILVIPVHAAPKKAPCPHCGVLARRKRKLTRHVRTIAYKQIAYLRITYGEYQPRCGCCAAFRTNPDGVLPKHFYDNKVRQAVLERILDDGMNLQQTRACLQRDFLLDLSTGFVYDCLHEAVARTHLAEHRQHVLERFSRTLCVDELHLGEYTLLLATDPLGDFPVPFALVSQNDQAHMERFLRNLVHWGLAPRVVVTDGSNLYPKLLAELWPAAAHQLCVFHIIKDINELVLDGVKRLRRAVARRGRSGRKRKAGRPKRGTRRQRQQLKLKEKAHFVFKHRYLIVKRREKLTESECEQLKTMLAYLPELRVLRRFVDRVYELLSAEQTEAGAREGWRKLQSNRRFQAVPELVKALAVLSEEKFAKVIAYVRSPVGERVRTNNHVERCNRGWRWLEKVRYKWRRRRWLVRYVVLWAERVWREKFREPPATTSASSAVPAGGELPAAEPAAEEKARWAA
jgi:hypothetical protein